MQKGKIAITFGLMLGMASFAMPKMSLGAQYGMAGCGLGSMVFKDSSSKFKQILAVTTNASFYSQLFGITSGTSNCKDQGDKMAAKERARMFISVNRKALEKDISRGNGQALSNLGQIMGCEESAQLGSSLQKQFSRIFPKAEVTAEKVQKKIFSAVREEKDLQQTCQKVG